MSRLIFIVVVIALAYWLYKSYRKRLPKQDESTREQNMTNGQDMISCAHCGIHVPKSESLLLDGKYYCCTAHSQGQANKQADK